MKGLGEPQIGRVAWALLALCCFTGCTVLTPVPTITPTPTLTVAGGVQHTPTVASSDFLTPIPPTPTFTPEPTPTPVLHSVESGETLLGIALEYGVSLQALQAANGIDNPQYLRLGQVLIIPISTEAPPELVVMDPSGGYFILPTPTPMALAVQGVRQYQTPVGGLMVLGEVRNTADLAVTNLQVQTMLLDANNNPLQTRLTLAAADYLAPGETAPFAALFPNPPTGVAEVRTSLVRGEPIAPITASFAPLAVTDVSGAVSGPQYRVTGQILNNAGSAVSRIVVVVTLYDAEGHVLGYRQQVVSADAPLPANDSRPFEVLLTAQGQQLPATFNVLAWGSRTP